jgi:hypothetical protein
MDKEFILKFLEPHHTDHNEGLSELVEVFGIETVKKFFLHCECIQVRVPSLATQKELIKDVIRHNMKTMKPRVLQSKLGIGRDRFKKYMREIEEEDNIRA